MASSVSHPVNPSVDESLLDRVTRISLLLGLLGPLGFLGSLQRVHGVFELAELFYIFFLLFFVPPALTLLSALWDGLRSLYRRLTGTAQASASMHDGSDPRSWIEMGYEASPLKTLQVVALIVHPNTALRGLFQMGGAIVAYVRHGGRLPRPETFESAVEYRPPFDGEWTVVNGSPDDRYSHS